MTRRVELVVGVGGPSGAGKSTIVLRLEAHLGEPVGVLPYDAYYRDLTALTALERDLVNFDCPEALEGDLLVAHLKALRGGVGIPLPHYDFVEHVRRAESTPLEPTRIVVVEGLFVLADQNVRNELDLAVYVHAHERSRLERRIARDIRERGWSEARVRRDWSRNVRPAEHAFVEPSKQWADVVISNDAPLDHSIASVIAAIKNKLMGTHPQPALISHP